MSEKKAIYSISSSDRAAQAVEQTRIATKSWAERRKELSKSVLKKPARTNSWRRETYRLPRNEARDCARQFFEKYPKAAYWSEIENWRVLEDDIIEFTMKRLPSAD